MSLRTKSRIPASTSDTAAILLSTSPVSSDSIFGMTFIIHPLFRVVTRECPPHDELQARLSGRRILTASRPSCGNAGSLPGYAVAQRVRQNRGLPALLETRGPSIARVRGPERDGGSSRIAIALQAKRSGGAGGQDRLVTGEPPGSGHRHPRQMDGAAQHLLDQVEGIEQDTNVAQPALLELDEMREAQRDRLAGFQRCERVAQHGSRRVDGAHHVPFEDLPVRRSRSSTCWMRSKVSRISRMLTMRPSRSVKNAAMSNCTMRPLWRLVKNARMLNATLSPSATISRTSWRRLE